MTKRPLPEPQPKLYHSSPILDRQSRFLAIFTPSTASPKSIQQDPSLASASHRILAWRNPSSQKTLSNIPRYDTGSDDDGEQYAGKKLEKVLIEMDIIGVVVVGRWFGGVMLGPVRFEHIMGVAREAIGQWKVEEGGKRVKIAEVNHQVEKGMSVEDETKVKERLVRVLKERDGSIVVLRGLLAEKSSGLNQGTDVSSSQPAPGNGTESSTQNGTAVKVATGPDYAKMPLPVLKKLEVAKDSTIALILKKIDEVEFEAEMGDFSLVSDGQGAGKEMKEEQSAGNSLDDQKQEEPAGKVASDEK